MGNSTLRPKPHGVEGARLDQRLRGALVAGDRLDLVEVVGEGGVLPLGLAAADDRLDHVGADVAHGLEPEEDDVVALGGEVVLRLVDVQRSTLMRMRRHSLR
jgi:hypothetical protein